MWHAYVDESGDRGWKRRPAHLPPGKRGGSSPIFSMSAVLVPAGAEDAALIGWDRASSEIGRKGRVIHWQNVKTDSQRRHLANAIAAIPDVQTISVVLCKWHLPNVSTLTDPSYFYHWTLRLLLERLSYFARWRNDSVRMTLAQVTGHSPKTVVAYLRRLGMMPTSIEWGHIETLPTFSTPAKRRMLQVADAVSGAVFGRSPQMISDTRNRHTWRSSSRPSGADRTEPCGRTV
jgi:hypothetical protein